MLTSGVVRIPSFAICSTIPVHIFYEHFLISNTCHSNDVTLLQIKCFYFLISKKKKKEEEAHYIARLDKDATYIYSISGVLLEGMNVPTTLTYNIGSTACVGVSSGHKCNHEEPLPDFKSPHIWRWPVFDIQANLDGLRIKCRSDLPVHDFV